MAEAIGEIYMIRNKLNGKVYIGQALKYTGKVKLKWGTNGRWKSHLREALNENGKDHCIYLNNAIRAYGEEAFEVTTLCDCKTVEEMNTMEAKYIKDYNSMNPNGYNLTYGGARGKDSDETREKKRLMRLDKKHPEQVKDKIAKGQLGNRRTAKPRKYPEDNTLPKYIGAKRKEGNIIGYNISCFPIGIDKKEYISKLFTDTTNPENAYKKAIEFLDELKKKYKHVLEPKESNTEHEAQTLKSLERNARTKKIGQGEYSMPKYVIYKSNGFAIDGLRIINDDGTIKIYHKSFTSKKLTMEEKLAQAIAHLEEYKKTHKCLIDEHISTNTTVSTTNQPMPVVKKKIVHKLKKIDGS